MKREFHNIAALIKYGRNKENISQTRLSKELGYKNGQFISNVERGLCSIPPKKIKELSYSLNIPTDRVIENMVLDYQKNLESILDMEKSPLMRTDQQVYI